MQKLPREFYNRDTVLVAKQLLGKYLIHHVGNNTLIGKIVEVEAYVGPHDLAAHSAKGLTNRTATMFGPPGHAYVYMIYGIYHCMNVVTEHIGHASAVLIRALEPVSAITEPTQGPGLLCKALSIDKHLNGHDLTTSTHFYIAEGETEAFSVIKKPRIGVAYAKEWANKKLRFYIKNNPYISKP